MENKYIHILNKYINPKAIPILNKNWNDPLRFYHNEKNHLIPLLNYIDTFKHKLLNDEYDALILAAFFHDSIYNPYSITNEDDSIKFFLKSYKYKLNNLIKLKVIGLIECTKYRIIPTGILLSIFWKGDNDILYQNIDKLIIYEKNIRKEYSRTNDLIYKENRIKFLQSCKYYIKNNNIDKLIEYIKS